MGTILRPLLPLLTGTLASAAAVTLFVGCNHENDPISKAEEGDAVRPSIAETKAIAEEGFIVSVPPSTP